MHACPDGVAIAGSRPSTAPAGCVDASHDLEIGPCVTRLRLALAATLVATLLSASFALEWWRDISCYDATIGHGGVALFGPVTARLAPQR
ncbi:hypothetical protein [Bradyrhizobium sp. Gha]|uniref:hypothetical protein n=1 Tax=Bradyrhizobium sp. Gha TaxID=1855318 RepID=UPI0008F2286F|nr:hypothetical protein [Bradyrhizobium sp. Gha]SFJ83625.1 hypothetical protein SAMN05216525_13827 [Bradyrhizobium sp. Gha]